MGENDPRIEHYRKRIREAERERDQLVSGKRTDDAAHYRIDELGRIIDLCKSITRDLGREAS
jgi:hypothetical protein